jgi:hypothetical protein
MSSRAFLFAAPVVVFGLTALSACGSSPSNAASAASGDDGSGATPPAPEASVVDAGDAAVEALAAVAVYQGSPLCNASPATSCCYPDALSLCAPTACVAPSDAGTSDGGASSASVVYGCHLAPAPANPGASGGSTSAPGVQQVTPACTPAGLGLDGALCQQPNDCAPGYECVGSEGTCRHYCCEGTSACRIDQFCDIQQTTQTTPAPTLSVPVCMPVRQCVLLQPDACPGQTCAVVREDGSVSCVAVGSATVGQSCETEHCAANLVCLGATARTCYALCEMSVAGQCPTGQSCKGGPPLFLDPGVGVCQ